MTDSLRKAASLTYRSARRIAVAIIGTTVVMVGIAMLVLPGPAFVVIPTGLAILGIEFAWARRWLKKIKGGAEQSIGMLRGNGSTAADRSQAGGRQNSDDLPPPSVGEKVPHVPEKHV